MKKSNLLFGWLAAGLALPAGAQTQQAPAAEMVEIEVHFVKTTQAQTPGILVSDDQWPMTAPPPANRGILGIRGVLTPDQTKEILAQLKKAGAEIFTAPRTVVLSGRKARVQNVREFLYPSEYSVSDKPTAKAVPVAFASKNVGISMEFEPKTGPAGLIELNFSTQIGELTGFADHPASASGQATKKAPETSPANTVWQPVFKNFDMTTHVTLSSGQTVAFSSPGENPEAKYNLLFVTAWELVEE